MGGGGIHMTIYKEIHQVDQAKGTVVIVHGSGEHFGRYQWLRQKLNNAGFHVIGGDLPGLGCSYGKKGHIDDFNDYYKIVDEWVSEAHQFHMPVFLLGHSMGGLIVIRYLERYQEVGLKGVIVTSPCLGLVRKVSPFLEGIVGIINLFYPSFCMPSGILPEQVSKDPKIVHQYRTDPLICKKVSVRWYLELKKEMESSIGEIDKYPHIPTLVMQAGRDKIVDQEKTKKWVENLSIPQFQYIEWPELYHELFNEPEKEKVYKNMVEWMKKIEIP